jgi:hypothetical protein
MDWAILVGALVPTLLLSRLLLWITRTWDGGVSRLLLVHGVSLLICVLLGGLGLADGGAFAPGLATAQYALPQILWLAVDLVRHRRGLPPIISGGSLKRDDASAPR